ncbi:MAG: glucose-1-phosphate adenylyltransferase subunit GlgD [Clostridia bacterium]|nr:glucose-1-phosphate adenylyltransferase subunit GlgD [Clostridia bacterium]
MAAKNVLGIIFSNAYDEVIPEITAFRTMGSVPFASRYRLIDFQLSYMVNAGIPRVGILTNSNYRSLMDHIGNGKAWDLARKREGLTILPPFNHPDTGVFKGKLDALYGSIGYISDSGKDYVLVTDCNIVSDIDYDSLMNYHLETKAEITLAYSEGLATGIKNGMEYELSDDGRITAMKYIDSCSDNMKTSLKTMVINRTLLERLLHEANSKRITDFETFFADNTSNLRIYGYRHDGYVKIIENIKTYYEANLDLLNPEVRNALFTPEKPIYTKTSDKVPAKYGITAKAVNSLIADGCKVYGEVENCILFRGVTVSKGAKIKNSIIMQDTFIGENAAVEYVITDKDVNIGAGKKLCGAENYPIYIGKGINI